MNDDLLLGLWRYIIPIPRFIWQRRKSGEGILNFMSAEHHRVRDFAVMELPRLGKPLPPERIARETGLPLARVEDILADLERHKTFLFRDDQGRVTWAYPVTVDRTPHHVTFSTGERIDAA